MALVPLTCAQGEQSTEQLLRQAFLYDNVNDCFVLKTNASSSGGGSATNGTLTQPAMTTVSALVLASASYSSAVITNTTDETVYLGLGFVPTITGYTVSIGTGESYIINSGEYTGAINGITASNPTTGNLNVTALS